MWEVVLYYDNLTFTTECKDYKDASLYLSKMIKEDDNIMLGSIVKDGKEIKVISNIGYYYEAIKILYGYYR